jgi:hypothetical protein
VCAQIGLVFFNEVVASVALVTMDDAGKQKALDAISRMSAGGKTNLSAGLLQAIKLLRFNESSSRPQSRARRAFERKVGEEPAAEGAELDSILPELVWKDRPATRAIILFTDGKANRGTTVTSDLLQMSKGALAGGGEGVTLFTFGYGGDHYAPKLISLASDSNGLYYFIEHPEDISQSFTDCLGGIVGTCAQEANLDLTAVNGTLLSEVNCLNVQYSDGDQHCKISLGNLYAGETKDLLVRLRIPYAHSKLTFITVEDAAHDTLTFCAFALVTVGRQAM